MLERSLTKLKTFVSKSTEYWHDNLIYIECNIDFKRAIFRIESDSDKKTTILEVKVDGQPEWTHCFTYPQDIAYSVHTYISSGSPDMERKRRAVFINSIKFYDNELEIAGENDFDH